MTTIRVPQSVRDQVNEIANSQGISAGSVIEALLQEHIERSIMDKVRRKMQSMTVEEKAEYENEIALWDSTSGDGLGICRGVGRGMGSRIRTQPRFA